MSWLKSQVSRSAGAEFDCGKEVYNVQLIIYSTPVTDIEGDLLGEDSDWPCSAAVSRLHSRASRLTGAVFNWGEKVDNFQLIIYSARFTDIEQDLLGEDSVRPGIWMILGARDVFRPFPFCWSCLDEGEAEDWQTVDLLLLVGSKVSSTDGVVASSVDSEMLCQRIENWGVKHSLKKSPHLQAFLENPLLLLLRLTHPFPFSYFLETCVKGDPSVTSLTLPARDSKHEPRLKPSPSGPDWESGCAGRSTNSNKWFGTMTALVWVWN